MASSNRILWIDIAKTLGIFLVVLGHFNLDNKDVAGYIFMFHMPLFFFISGYLMSATRLDINTSGIKTFLTGKVRRLVIPYYLFQAVGLMLLLTRLLIGGGDLGEINWPDFLTGSLLAMPNQMFNTPAWFLISLFLCNILLYISYNFRFARYVVALAMIASIFIKFPTQFAIYTVPAAFTFFASGFVLKQFIASAISFINKNILLSLTCSVGLMSLLLYIYYQIGNLDIGKGEYTIYPIISLTAAYIGIMGFLWLCAVIQSIMPQKFITQKATAMFVRCSDATIVILGLHIFAVQIFSLHLPGLYGSFSMAVVASVIITGVLTWIYPYMANILPLLSGRTITKESTRIA